MKNYTWLALICVFVLTGCIPREEADAKLGKACEAAVKAFVADGMKLKEVKKTTYRDDSKLGKGYRKVILVGIESDGWYEPEKTYQCIFVEEFGPFNMSHSANIYQLDMDGQKYGKDGDQIVGGLDALTKLGEAVDKVLH